MTGTTSIKRFDASFLKDFFSDEVVAYQPAPTKEAKKKEETPPPPPAPTFSEQELEVAKNAAEKKGYDTGYEAGLQEGNGQKAAREQATTNALHMLNSKLSELREQYEHSLQLHTQQTRELALGIAETVLTHSLNEEYVNRVDRFLSQHIAELLHKPAITITLHPEFEEALSMRIAPLLEQQGFKGDILLQTNPDLGLYDITLAWDHGKIEQHVSRNMQHVMQLVAQFSALSPTIQQNEPPQNIQE